MEADDEQENSVFNLITRLCEIYCTNSDNLKETRSKCFEILLGKRISNYKKDFRDIKETSDPSLHLLAWQFDLAHVYNFKQHADELKNCANTVKDCIEDDDLYNRILRFLLDLRNIPKKKEEKLNLSTLSIFEDYDFNKLFQLPESMKKLCDDKKELDCFNKLFQLPKNMKTLCEDRELEHFNNLFENTPNLVQIPSSNTLTPNRSIRLQDNILRDVPSSISNTSEVENIWEIASKTVYKDTRRWETLRCPEPEKEKMFLSELGPLSSLWISNLESLYSHNLFKDAAVRTSRLVPRQTFIKDLKFLLAGLASESFAYDENGEFCLVPGISVETITPNSLLEYSKDFLFTGNCCKALNKLSTPNLETGRYLCQGYVFTEFCESINRYLRFYRTVVFSIPKDVNFLKFQEMTYDLRLQINTLASVSEIGPYKFSEPTRNSVDLLNSLYYILYKLTDQKTICVVYSILYACCQVYFSRFLQQWLMEGTLNDPYGEFFILSNSKYVLSRGRTFWTRSYSLKEERIPEFLVDLKSNILLCGKSMNLLKSFAQSSKLRMYLMGTKLAIISCCVTLKQLETLKHNNTSYYLDVYENCGPRFNLQNIYTTSQQEDPTIFALIAKKRAATLKRIELEREKVLLEQNEKKLEMISILKEQYDMSLAQKQNKIAREIEEKLNQEEQNFEIELKRQELIKEEASNIINHYAQLFEMADNRKAKIENYIKSVKQIHIDLYNDKSHEMIKDNSKEISTESSSDSYYSLLEESNKELKKTDKDLNELEETVKAEEEDSSWDIINANTEFNDDNANIQNTTNIQEAINNFEISRMNKHRVMTSQIGMKFTQSTPKVTADTTNITYMSQAQKNKLKVLSSEYGISIKPDMFKTNHISAAAFTNKNRVMEISEYGISDMFKTNHISAAAFTNKNRVMGISDCFNYRLDNEIFLNKNNSHLDQKEKDKLGMVKKSKSLLLDLNKDNLKPKVELDRPVPMSVDSTPLSDFPHSPLVTPSSSMVLSCETGAPTTADTQQMDEEFDFLHKPKEETVETLYINRSDDKKELKKVFSRRIGVKDAKAILTNSLGLFLHECVQIPLLTQITLLNDELIRYFIEDLEYLKHLSSLRDYFFLQDGEFGRHITDNLFTKLYEVNVPAQLINCRTLQDIVFGAIDMSSKNQRFSSNLSFRVNIMPKCFDLGNPDVLNCLSLVYKIKWPLNILLPTDTIGKYDEVFKFLLKLNRVSWALKKIFMELKVLARETGKKEIYLMSSPQYRKLHLYRHIMTQFVQTFQSYVVGEVLQSSWANFEKALITVTNLDELYDLHTNYIKNILFMCFLSQKMVVFKKIIHKTFMVVLKFFDYLRSKSWICEDGAYIHPNFHKLQCIFENFQEFVLYMFKVIRKIAKSGYHPHLLQLLEMLDINWYYTEFLKIASSSERN